MEPAASPPSEPILTNPVVFIACSIFCIFSGTVLGYLCAWTFYEVSHPKVSVIPGARFIGTQIPMEIGIVFIIIMAATGLMVALTAHYVPRWTVEYYKSGKMPEWLVRLYETLIRWKEAFLEINTRK